MQVLLIKLGLGIIIGIAITGLIIQLIIAKKVILPLNFLFHLFHCFS
jgi:hypothetical protein